jgi:hypothetical protein
VPLALRVGCAYPERCPEVQPQPHRAKGWASGAVRIKGKRAFVARKGGALPHSGAAKPQGQFIFGHERFQMMWGLRTRRKHLALNWQLADLLDRLSKRLRFELS